MTVFVYTHGYAHHLRVARLLDLSTNYMQVQSLAIVAFHSVGALCSVSVFGTAYCPSGAEES
ncbi:hypothetical protein BJI47_21455 [Rhodococcus sp. 1168]|nr:hypothetical protein BJI47_21455 [Rhodococcus sp. 1168]